MDSKLIFVYLFQIKSQCEFATEAEKSLKTGVEGRDGTAMFYAIQNFLTATANISKACWGQKGKHAAARKPIRDAIGISDQSPIKTRDMRNNFEHFDERLDYWWNNSARRNYADNCVMDKSAILGFDVTDMFRIFDPSTGQLGFWGQTFNVYDIANEIRSIYPTVCRALELSPRR